MKRLPARSRALTLIELAERIAATIAASIRRSCAQASPPPPVSAKRCPPMLSEIAGEEANVRGQVHVRLSRNTAPSATISLSLGGQRFELAGGGGDAWSRDRRMDAAIVAAMRSAGSMSVSARDRAGRRFTDRYSLEGAATAMDAATVGCARLR